METPSTSGFGRWLYRSYFQGAGLRHFFERRIKPAGGVLLAFLVLSGCLVVGNERDSNFQIFSLCFLLLAVSTPWAFLRRVKLRARRELPRHATAGEPLRYAILLTNSGNRPISHAWLTEMPPDPRPSREDFLLLREPGEEERNAFDRTFAYFRWQWLLLRNRMISGGHSNEEIRLAPGASTRIFMEIIPLKRGVIPLADLRVLLPDPLRFFQASRKVEPPSATLTVLPRRYPLPVIGMPGATAFQIAGEATTNTLGSAGEFAGLRDYRPGDPLRQIHWKSWARTGRPVVKEVEDIHYPRYGLVLDTFESTARDSSFETTVSVAASFAVDIPTDDSLLDLMFVNDQAFRVTAGRGVERAEKLLEALAGVSPRRTPNYRELSALVARYQDDLTSCLIVLNGWDETRAAFLKSLTSCGLVCVPLIIAANRPPHGTPGYWIDSAHPARALSWLPNQLKAAD